MKRVFAALAVLAASMSAGAAEYAAIGRIAKIIAVDRLSYGGDDLTQILVSGFTTAGSCPVNDGMVVLNLRSDDNAKQLFALAMMAWTSRETVRVRVNDGYQRQGGGCYLKYIELRQGE